MFRPFTDPFVSHAPAARAVGGMGASAQVAAGLALGDVRPARERTAPVDRIVATVGLRYHERRTMQLIGMARGAKRQLGSCLLNGRAVVWDYWFPHLGIAVDARMLEAPEVDAKCAWATVHGVIYCSPQVNVDDDGRFNFALLAQVAAERRAEATGV